MCHSSPNKVPETLKKKYNYEIIDFLKVRVESAWSVSYYLE